MGSTGLANFGSPFCICSSWVSGTSLPAPGPGFSSSRGYTMEPATPQGTSGNPSSTARRHRTLQAVLLFFLILLIVLIGAMLTGAFGAKTTVSSTQATATANARAGLSGSFANGGDGSVVL